MSNFDPRALERLATLYNGLLLLGCLPGSPADLAGLRWGDIIVSVNGSPTPNVQAFIDAKGFHDGQMSVRLVRDGQELHILLQGRTGPTPSIEQVLCDMIEARGGPFVPSGSAPN